MSGWLIPGMLAQAALAATFTVSALAKIRPTSELKNTLAGLGLGPTLARLGSVGLIIAELAAGVGLAVAPAQAWPRIESALLAVTFAAAGGYTIVTGRNIDCNCFGTIGERLGRRQIAMLPLWLGACLLAQVGRPAWPITAGLIALVVLILGLGVVRVFRSRILWQALRDDRSATG